MSNFSGYDSDAIGFGSISQNKSLCTSSSTQTIFSETGTGSQTNMSKDCGSMTSPQGLNTTDNIIKEYPPPGLNDFLKRIVPAVMEELNKGDTSYCSSESDDEECLEAKLNQEIKINCELPEAGDHETLSILDVSWSCAGNSIAVSIGKDQHEEWCQHDGLIKIYTLKASEGDKFIHSIDIAEKNCVTVVKYHPSLAALLAYGTTSGEVVLCSLRNTDSGFPDNNMQLTSPAGCHSSKRVSFLQWADTFLTNIFLTLQVVNGGKRRGASDQVLISSGSDGSLNIWQVNASKKIFQSIVTYLIKDSAQKDMPDITCFDFIKTLPLRPSGEKVSDDVFVVGSSSGRLYLCKAKTAKQIMENTADPVYDTLEGHSTCILGVEFSFQKAEIFVSISMDSELRVYDINQMSPLKVIHIDHPISCMAGLPNFPCIVILGLSRIEGAALKVYNVSNGRPVPVEGLIGDRGSMTSIAVNQSGACRIAAGDSLCTLRIWDLPSRKFKYSIEDLEF